MNDMPPTAAEASASMARIRDIKALRTANPGMSLSEAVRRWDAGERVGDDSDVWEYSWRWADKDDDYNQTFARRLTRDQCIEWVRRQNDIAPAILLRRPRAIWVEVEI